MEAYAIVPDVCRRRTVSRKKAKTQQKTWGRRHSVALWSLRDIRDLVLHSFFHSSAQRARHLHDSQPGSGRDTWSMVEDAGLYHTICEVKIIRAQKRPIFSPNGTSGHDTKTMTNNRARMVSSIGRWLERGIR